jgi:hypothetical protein
MPCVGQFCPSNIVRLLLGVIIFIALLAAIGFRLYQSPGRGTSIEQSTHAPTQPNDGSSTSGVTRGEWPVKATVHFTVEAKR